MKAYKDIFIDFDDTLYDTRGNAIIALAETFDFFSLGRYFDNPQDFYDSYWKTNLALWTQYNKGEIDRQYLIVERFRRPLSEGRGLENVTEKFCLEVSDKFLDFCSNKPGTVKGATELVEYLKGLGCHLHICSNGFHEIQYKKLRACGLYDYFDTVILSEDAGANKPSKKFFDYAFEKSGAKVETTLMIGDNYIADIEGAMDAGLDTILYNRWDASFVPPRKPTYIVNELGEIMKLL
jgi:putative hydrolase of the HAD superfamily